MESKKGIWEIKKGKNNRVYIECNDESKIMHPQNLCKMNGLGVYGYENLKDLSIAILKYEKEGQHNEEICVDFLLSKGFSTAKRWFDKKWEQFRVYYKIEGYDCDILLSPTPQSIGDMTQEEQVDEFSEIQILEKHHYGDWHVYINTIDNHLTTLNEQRELVELMKTCKCPLIGT
ncbi:hypothetical protein [Flammeovirga sp. SJP92]|uniref:hypothetical protein n=1 Tax=Flammeovirga sp. SJP92 TaxID=1775430 RepID=UPI00078928AD|nr:hypothetical protein [Flammeovirga sp. SJP92]KXX72758.1 hypothetical protein AVL50_32170 [Flammeovirga sp. SJP92]